MNEHGDKELKEIYYDYIYDKKKKCVNHTSICLVKKNIKLYRYI